MSDAQTSPSVSNTEYRALAEFRHRLREFLSFSERASRDAGLEPQQHQLLLALKGLPAGRKPTIGEMAERLQLRHHSTVELVDRLEQRGLVRRARDPEDARQVLVVLRGRGEKLLHQLSVHHRAELRNSGPLLVASLQSLLEAQGAMTPHHTS